VYFYRKSVEESLLELKSGRTGLTADEARARRATYGPNELAEKQKKSVLLMFLGQFKDLMILVLIAAAVVSGIIGEPSDTVAIVVILVLNAALGFSQEYRAEKAMAALKKMAAANSFVLRSGQRVTLPAAEIVPGDIVLIEAGNVVPADLRLIESASLSVDEAALTGESMPVEKHSDPLPDDMLPLADRKNMLYKGTVVTYGRGRGVATATAMKTELGRIATMLQLEEEGKTPLQKRLAHFGQRISILILIVCAVVFIAGLLRGEPVVVIFLVAVSLAVAAIPEALPAVITIALALGARKMVMQNALVRKLPAVETLGSVTYICTDKTGTLTLNKMTAEEMWVDGKTIRNSEFGIRSRPSPQPSPQRGEGGSIPHSAFRTPHSIFLTALALSNDACLDTNGDCAGDPTEAALLAIARDHGYRKEDLETAYPRIAEIPFDSARKLMTTIHRSSSLPHSSSLISNNYVSFTKGAFDVLLDRADSILSSEGPKPVQKDEIQAAHDRMAAEGLRVIAVGLRTWAAPPDVRPPENVESKILLLGLAGIMDPPREEAMKAVAECRSAGITPVMITGDHPLTARVIARRVGILENSDPEALITGRELAALPLEAFEKRVEDIRVYARVAPEQKLKIVRALQDRGHFVAMTGDGVNDAPALKRADIGVAMGVTGADVAKEASAMILLDDNFATIVRAVREGRKIYDNIRKFIRYLLATNSGEIWALFLAPFFGLPIPLQPIHILWINLVTDSLPALALTLEPGEANLMSRPPRSPREGLFSHGLGVHAVWVGLLMAAVVLSLQAWSIHIRDPHWQTMVFTTLCLLQLGHVMAIRSEYESLFTQGVLSNKALFLTVVATIALQLMTVYVPALNPVFRTQPLSAGELIAVLALSSIVFVAVEIEKLIKRFQKTA
jgi:P-type Ca2+ transporter type 2C